MWASDRLPSMPSHSKRSYGNRLASFQLSLIVKNPVIPAPRRSCGIPPENPKTSGSQATVLRRAERLLEVALAVDELADERLAAGDVAVGLEPHAADRLPAALGHALLDPLEDGGIVLLDPGIGLGGGLVEGEIGVALHQVEHGREGAPDLAAGLGERPEPGEVDVGVAGQAEPADRRIVAA